MRLSKHEYFLQMAELVSRRSTCLRRNVGAVLVNRLGHVLATGYNGVASGMPHCNEPTDVVPQSELTQTFFPYRFQEEPGEEYEDIASQDVFLYGAACQGASYPSGQNLDSCQAIHAEQNALLQCHDVQSIHAVYVTASPCTTCTKLLMNTSAELIVFREEYPHKEARDLWGASRGPGSWLHYPQNALPGQNPSGVGAYNRG